MNDTNVTDSFLDELKNLGNYLKSDINTTINPISSTITENVSSVTTIMPPVSGFPSKITEDNINEFILAKSEELINSTLDTIASLKPLIATTADAKSMSGFAEIIKAATGAMDTLNSINIEKRKAKTTRELKQLEADTKKLLASNQKPNNTVNIIAGRETIMKMLRSPDAVIEGEYTVEPKIED
jgi:hypothetical protein